MSDEDDDAKAAEGLRAALAGYDEAKRLRSILEDRDLPDVVKKAALVSLRALERGKTST